MYYNQHLNLEEFQGLSLGETLRLAQAQGGSDIATFLTITRDKFLIVPQSAKVSPGVIEEVPDSEEVFEVFLARSVRCTACEKDLGYIMGSYNPDANTCNRYRDYMYLRQERVRLVDTLECEKTHLREKDVCP